MQSFDFSVLFLCSLLFGSIIGAYFGTAEYRIRQEAPLLTRDCFCPVCGHILTGLEQIPVLSWLFLKGRCRWCRCPISIRYPLIEGGFLLYYGAVFLLFRETPVRIPLCWFGFTAVLLAVRCRGYWLGLAKGLAVFAVYHLLFGGVFLMVCAAASVSLP